MKILLAEDRTIVIRAMQILIESEFGNYKLEIAANAEMLETALQSPLYRLAIISPRVVQGSSIKSILNIRNHYPALDILIFSSHINDIYSNYLYQRGFKGYVPEDSPDSEIVYALKAVLGGNTYFGSNRKRYFQINMALPVSIE